MTSRLHILLVSLCVLFFASCDSSSDESCLTVTPSENYVLSGTAMTTNFTPASKTYTVSNTCGTDIMLAVVEEVRWLDVEIDAFGGGGNESGTLSADTSIDVVIEVRYGTDNAERLDQLDPGSYNADLRFEDDTNNEDVSLMVNLTVNTP